MDAAFELAGVAVDDLGVDHVINVDPATGAAAVSGLPDVVVERPGRFTWFPSLGKDGFAAAMDIPKPAASPGVSLPRIGEDPDLDLRIRRDEEIGHGISTIGQVRT